MDKVYLWYFVSHIPITLLIDVQPLLPPDMIPQVLHGVNRLLTETLGDPFMIVGAGHSELVWFRSMLLCELILQLPFFFYAVWALWTDNPHRHLPFLVYGVHVSTTMIPVLGTLVRGEINRTCGERMLLASMYLPYLLVPLSMALISFTKCSRAISAATATLPSKRKTA
ncbi:transmembrane protein 97 [Coemansia reversa NRRL 1564]|uniref:Efficient mitochondria targeting-associated protein 19 n=1 Tax=Coemansia reversa (strain ATCC 12441 / NRRL 1564) TaxID=763665 RepID=A0A2G5BF61_COERN|nr:transmembrane protein 97 [Coemansia reversa NRRL 1564]|eukprot:PIA17643.1 transmembrane protein 97 [Coemansia reversa NRRL 1564]